MPIVIDPTLLVRNAAIRRGMEGPQLIVTWEVPSNLVGVEKLVVVRKKYEFPVVITAPGQKTVWEGAPADGYVTDTAPDIEACACYYYTIFTKMVSGLELYEPVTQVSDFAIETGFFAKKLFELLPDAYVVSDKKLEEAETSKLALTRSFDSATKEFFNLLEDGTIERGQLQRFLRVVAIELDIVKGLIDCLPYAYDVDEACCKFLQPMAALIGLQLNTEFGCIAQRNEIKSQVAILKVKGTKTAVEARARIIASPLGGVHIKEWCGNVLVTNRLDRTTLKIPNPGFATSYGLAADTTDYVIGGTVGLNKFTVFVLLDCDDCLSDRIVEKLERVLPAEWPICRIGSIVFIDCVWVEHYVIENILEDVKDVIIDATIVEQFIPFHWLITNRLSDANPGPPPIGPSPVFPFERHYSNSLRALTANRFRVAVERWWDEGVDEMIATGSYVGNGAAGRAIPTGLLGTLRYVKISDPSGTVKEGWKSDTMVLPDVPADSAVVRSALGPAVAFAPAIAFLGANFLVDPVLNDLGVTYHWVALSS